MQFLQIIGLGGDIGGGYKGHHHDELRAERMDTYWFNPDESHINRCVEDPGVKAYLAMNRYHQPVFLITGLMIARGASAIQKQMKAALSTHKSE